MKRNHNKGFTLIELISAIAILSIVGISAFTLLMFSIRSNNVIVTGTSAAQDADLLNKRLKILLEPENCYIRVETPEQESVSTVIRFYSLLEKIEGKIEYVPTGESLIYTSDGILKLVKNTEDGFELLQDNLTSFEAELVPDTNLLRISYSIGDREFTKLFRVNLAASENTP